ncbi:hypothetical protein J6590_036188 [Homalodisca vitripennis]|nr:hypothetical protein J6590_036188 [Homalodisca vitripennis]
MFDISFRQRWVSRLYLDQQPTKYALPGKSVKKNVERFLEEQNDSDGNMRCRKLTCGLKALKPNCHVVFQEPLANFDYFRAF